MRNPAAQGKRDANQTEIIAAFRKMGCAVVDLGSVGSGVPDLMVSDPVQRRTHLVEVKTRKGKISSKQRDFENEWHSPIYVCRTLSSVVTLVNLWRRGLVK